MAASRCDCEFSVGINGQSIFVFHFRQRVGRLINRGRDKVIGCVYTTCRCTYTKTCIFIDIHTSMHTYGAHTWMYRHSFCLCHLRSRFVSHILLNFLNFLMLLFFLSHFSSVCFFSSFSHSPSSFIYSTVFFSYSFSHFIYSSSPLR